MVIPSTGPMMQLSSEEQWRGSGYRSLHASMVYLCRSNNGSHLMAILWGFNVTIQALHLALLPQTHKEHLQIPVLSPCPLTSEQCKRRILTARGTWAGVGRHGSTRGNQWTHLELFSVTAQSFTTTLEDPETLCIVHCLTTSHHKQKACEDGSQLSWLTLVWGRLKGRALLADLAGRSGMLRTLRGWNNNTAPRDGGEQQNV